MVIERVAPSRMGDYRALMLEAYAAHPKAFTSSATEQDAWIGGGLEHRRRVA
jgi:hypothetical protein